MLFPTWQPRHSCLASTNHLIQLFIKVTCTHVQNYTRNCQNYCFIINTLAVIWTLYGQGLHYNSSIIFFRERLLQCFNVAANTSVTFTLRRPYGGRRTPKSSDSCGCRRNSAVAVGPPYGECFTGRRGGRRIIARSYNFFHFYVRHRNLTRRSHAVDRTVAVWSPYGPLAGRLAYALIFDIKTTAAAGTPYGDRASSPQRT